jgi:hypothetical protein
MLASDAQFRAFHEGRSRALPTFYANLFERRLGRLAELLPPETRYPILEPPTARNPQQEPLRFDRPSDYRRSLKG